MQYEIQQAKCTHIKQSAKRLKLLNCQEKSTLGEGYPNLFSSR